MNIVLMMMLDTMLAAVVMLSETSMVWKYGSFSSNSLDLQMEESGAGVFKLEVEHTPSSPDKDPVTFSQPPPPYYYF